ncbi:MAG TPA: hypothetical protein VGQ20_01530 [Acidimicrobiales bacterium]|jgi:hypothetical protein|nr:hypothetical protein [Acidimicrobiales bacterium]
MSTHRLSRWAFGALLLVGTTTCRPAYGQGPPASGEAGYRDGYVFAGYIEHPVEVAEATTNRPRRPVRWCVHWPMSLAPGTDRRDHYLTAAEVQRISREQRGQLIPGRQYVLLCYWAGDEYPDAVSVITYNPRDPTSGQVTTIETVETYARDLLQPPAPAVSITPPAGRLVVGFETWLATPSSLVTAPRTAQAGPLWATADAVPVSITYDMGDDAEGSRFTCPAPNRPEAAGTRDEDRPSCTRYTYRDSHRATGVGNFTVTATVTYEVWLVTSDDPVRHVADTIAGPPTELPVTVREIQALIR